ncbi:hypothetical protein H5410_042740 [Solanum commersonii]|uniref:F-box domain-containing protein n=1 Tax=Solanum commersonii TaxID=4109 RepID=A0A9J5XWV7_SOLCO|nr:hypothetical protein H5410_042740 [Solanum commersonii]
MASKAFNRRKRAQFPSNPMKDSNLTEILPPELITEILLRVPVKSLLKFRVLALERCSEDQYLVKRLETMRNSRTSGVDTISNLPCNVLDVILGRLPFEDAVKTNCLFHPPLGLKGFEKLINLDLVHVTFDPSIFTNLIFKSPLLKRLRLCFCTNFDILKIDAANLKFFEFVGNTKSISFKNAPMLEKVIVAFLGQQLLTNTSPYLIKGGLPESPPTALNNIKYLNISSMSLRSVEVVSSAVYLIRSCPKLQDLTIEFDPVAVEDIVEPVVEFLRCQSFSLGAEKLQRVHVNLFMGLEMEMEFMKFI